MSYFWAKFQEVDGNVFRYDTRIYLSPIENPCNEDNCIGAVVGKNPGSAKANNPNNHSLQEIKLDGDKLLPTVRNIIDKSYIEAGKEIPDRGYIQMLNLFYLCNPNLGEAIHTIKVMQNTIFCSTEKQSFKWVWYVWGDKDQRLNQFKGRFESIEAKTNVFLNNKSGRVSKRLPLTDDFAKHTQGMRHALIVPFISGVIKNG